MAVDNEARFVWFMRRLCKSHRYRDIHRARGDVSVLAAVRAARRQFRDILLDAFAVRSVLGATGFPRAELLEVVHHSVHHLHGGACIEVNILAFLA